MGRKLLVALAMEGKFSTEGLQAVGEDDDLLMAMARELRKELEKARRLCGDPSKSRTRRSRTLSQASQNLWQRLRRRRTTKSSFLRKNLCPP